MKELDFLEGYEDGSFRPNAKITRGEMATILSNIIDVEVNEEEVDTLLSGFIDMKDMEPWAVENIAKVVKTGIMEGSNGKFLSGIKATRAEAATIIYRIYNR